MPKPPQTALVPLDASWPEMSEAELARQQDRHQPPPDDDPPERDLTLTQARKELASKTQELRKVTNQHQLARLVIDLQKARVLVMLLEEAEGDGKANPNTYRELALLNRMLGGSGGPLGPDPDDPNAPGQAEADELLLESEAASRLEKRGISRESIPQMVRVLTALGGRPGGQALPGEDPDDDEGDEPDMVVEAPAGKAH